MHTYIHTHVHTCIRIYSTYTRMNAELEGNVAGEADGAREIFFSVALRFATFRQMRMLIFMIVY